MHGMTKFNKLALQYWSRDEGQWLDGQPEVRRVSRKEFLLTAPYRATWEQHGVRRAITIPVGYRCDLSTIPRIFHTIVPKTGLHDGPSVVHDHCYEHAWRSRWETDCLFLGAMKVTGVHWLRRNVIFVAVRAGGWLLWNSRRRAYTRS